MNSLTLELRKFVAPEIITGTDARLLLPRYINHFSAKRPMIVTDPIVRKQTWFLDILDGLEASEIHYVIFQDITPNPKDFEVMMGSEFFLSNHCDLLVAIGGGSPMDAAKCIGIVSTNGGHVLDYEGVDEINLPGPPLICIPSTAGTSADVSQFAIVNDTDTNIKKAIISKKAVPDLALIDPKPLMTMTPYLSACTGMDALTHAIEAYVSNAHSTLTDIHALEAIQIIGQHIYDAVLETRCLEDMAYMMQASLSAGLAFSNASLGAVHAMAHSMGGLLDLAHGECNSILLSHVIALNFDHAIDRYKDIYQALTGLPAPDDFMAAHLTNSISRMREALGIPEKISHVTATDTIFDALTQAALEDPCMVTNPKALSFDEIRYVYEFIFQK